MAVSKRTRYEVLRRDNHTCRYCGGAAPDVILTVDHVTPVALGGADDPSNLVAACRDCNAGKSSSNPDAATVAQVNEDAVRWAAAIKLAAKQMQRSAASKARAHKAFLTVWTETPSGSWREPELPLDWRDSVDAWLSAGLPAAVIHAAVESTFAKRHVSAHDKFRYVAGICWNKITEMQDAARSAVAAKSQADEHVESDDYWRGYREGSRDVADYYKPRAEFYERGDFGHRILMGHIDRRTSTTIDAVRWAA